jgi:glycosyltransferase involved in cell wall biosynthesis
MPKVSIILPNYNHARFLQQRIESILSQTYQDFELILLDDASTDNSRDVLSQYLTDPRIQSDFNQTNSGSPFKQWNKGLNLAQGEYIWIAESDDYADPALLEKLVRVLDQHPSVGLAYCQSWEVDEQNTMLSTRQYWTNDLNPDRWCQDFISSGAEECRNYLIFKNTIPNASAVLFRANQYRDSQIDNEQFRLAGDWLAWVKLLVHCDIAFVSEPLNYYRTHAHTARKKTWRTLTAMHERLHIAEYVKTEVGLAPDTAAQVSLSLANRLLDILKQETWSNQHWPLIHQIADLNDHAATKLWIYQYLLRELIRQQSNRWKTRLRSRLVRSLS